MAFLIRREVYDIIKPYTPDAPLEDWFLMLQISKYYKMKYIDEILYSYRWHGNNQMNNNARIKMMTYKTLQYENYLIATLDRKGMLPTVCKFMDFVSKQSSKQKEYFIKIPYLFELYINYREYCPKLCLQILGMKFTLRRYEGSENVCG